MILTCTKRRRKSCLAPFGTERRGRINYTYTPYGAVTAEGDVTQPIQWSSEYHDTDLGLVYYNYRYYSPANGRWTRRYPIGIYDHNNIYSYVRNNVIAKFDELGEFFSQGEPTCCMKCDEYIEKKKWIYDHDIQNMLKKGCLLNFSCNNNIAAAGTTGQSILTGIISIKINCKVGATQSLDSTEDTFGHELEHAKDRCYDRLGTINLCKSVVCTEVRAYTVGGCKNKTGFDLLSCLKRRVSVRSVDHSCWWKNKDEINAMITESFIQECYAQ